MKKLFFIFLLIIPILIFSQNFMENEQALELDGIDDYTEEVDNYNVIPGHHLFSVTLWVKASSTQPNAVFEVISQEAGAWGTNFFFGKNADGTIRLSDSWVNTGIPFPLDDQWHHYAFTRDDNTTKIYIDGELKANAGFAIGLTHGATFRIGRQYGWHEEYFKGSVDEIKTYTKTLTSTDVLNDMRLQPTISQAAANSLHSYLSFTQIQTNSQNLRFSRDLINNQAHYFLNGAHGVQSPVLCANSTITSVSTASSAGWSQAGVSANNVHADVKYTQVNTNPTKAVFHRFNGVPHHSNLNNLPGQIMNNSVYSYAIDAANSSYDYDEIKIKYDGPMPIHYQMYPYQMKFLYDYPPNPNEWRYLGTCTGVSSTNGIFYVHFSRPNVSSLKEYIGTNPSIAVELKPYSSFTEFYPADEAQATQRQIFIATTNATSLNLDSTKNAYLIANNEIIETLSGSNITVIGKKIKFKFNTLLEEGQTYTIKLDSSLVYDQNSSPIAGVYRNTTWNVTAIAAPTEELATCGYFDAGKELVSNYSVIPQSGDFTLAFWAKPEEITGYREIISQTPGFFIGRHDNGTIRAPWSTGVPYPTDNQWHYFTVTKTDGLAKLYIDGEVVSEYTGTINTSGEQFKIGNQFGGYNEFYKGYLDEVRIWKRELSMKEVHDSMNRLNNSFLNHALVSYFSFNSHYNELNPYFDYISGIGCSPNAELTFNITDLPDLNYKYDYFGLEGPMFFALDSLKIDIDITNIPEGYTEVLIRHFTEQNTSIPTNIMYQEFGKEYEVQPVDSTYWHINYFGHNNTLPSTANMLLKFDTNLSQHTNAYSSNLKIINKPINYDTWEILSTGIDLVSNTASLGNITKDGEFCLVKFQLPSHTYDSFTITDTTSVYTSNITSISLKSNLPSLAEVYKIEENPAILPATYHDSNINQNFAVSLATNNIWKIKYSNHISNTRVMTIGDISFELDSLVTIEPRKIIFAHKLNRADAWAYSKPETIVNGNQITFKNVEASGFYTVFYANDLPDYEINNITLTENEIVYTDTLTYSGIKPIDMQNPAIATVACFNEQASTIPARLEYAPNQYSRAQPIGNKYWKLNISGPEFNLEFTANFDCNLSEYDYLERQDLYVLESSDAINWAVAQTVSVLDFANNSVQFQRSRQDYYFAFAKIARPSSEISYSSLDNTCEINEEVCSEITINNTSNADVEYRLPVIYQESNIGERIDRIYGERDSTYTAYSFATSDFSNDTSYNWFDITNTGTELDYTNENYVKLGIPFDFNFYGTTFDSLFVSKDTMLSFIVYDNRTDAIEANSGMIHLLSSHFDYEPGFSKILYQNYADKMVISFEDLKYDVNHGINPADSIITCQAILYNNNDIKLQFKKVPENMQLNQHSSYMHSYVSNENITFSLYFVNSNSIAELSNWHIKNEVAILAKQTFNIKNSLGIIPPHQQAVISCKYKNPFSSFTFDEFFVPVLTEGASEELIFKFKNNGELRSPKNVEIDLLEATPSGEVVLISWEKVFNANTYHVYAKFDDGDVIDITADVQFNHTESNCFYVLPQNVNKNALFFVKAYVDESTSMIMNTTTQMLNTPNPTMKPFKPNKNLFKQLKKFK